MARPAKDNKFEVVTHPRVFVFRTENEGKPETLLLSRSRSPEASLLDALGSTAAALGGNSAGTRQRSAGVWSAPLRTWVPLPETGSPGTEGDQVQGLRCHHHGGDLALQERAGESRKVRRTQAAHRSPVRLSAVLPQRDRYHADPGSRSHDPGWETQELRAHHSTQDLQVGRWSPAEGQQLTLSADEPINAPSSGSASRPSRSGTSGTGRRRCRRPSQRRCRTTRWPRRSGPTAPTGRVPTAGR